MFHNYCNYSMLREMAFGELGADVKLSFQHNGGEKCGGCVTIRHDRYLMDDQDVWQGTVEFYSFYEREFH